jgi:hypothetical protein
MPVVLPLTKPEERMTTASPTQPEAAEQLEAVTAVTDDTMAVIEEVVADMGYHSCANRSRSGNAGDSHLHQRTRSRAASRGSIKQRNVMPSMRIGAGPAASAGNGSSGHAENCWKDHAPHLYESEWVQARTRALKA